MTFDLAKKKLTRDLSRAFLTIFLLILYVHSDSHTIYESNVDYTWHVFACHTSMFVYCIEIAFPIIMLVYQHGFKDYNGEYIAHIKSGYVLLLWIFLANNISSWFSIFTTEDSCKMLWYVLPLTIIGIVNITNDYNFDEINKIQNDTLDNIKNNKLNFVRYGLLSFN